jgi:hypothetical protein
MTMKKILMGGILICAGVCVGANWSFGGAERTRARVAVKAEASSAQAAPAQGEKRVSYHAKGTFEPTVTPAGTEDKAEGSTLGRWSLAKKIHGDLEGTSEGQMLAASTNVKGSAGYVAMERVTGTLEGRRGSFVLQHSGTMSRGAFQLNVSVVPDSGSDELTGIAGTMTIQIAPDGKHSYEMDYTLPEKQ